MSPQHHLDPALLLAYAGGAASDAEGLLAATHLTLCGACRLNLATQERYAGVLLEQAEDAPLADSLLAATLARLDEGLRSTPPPRAPDPKGDGDGLASWTFGPERVSIPRVLHERLRRGSAPSLRFLAPGFRGIDLPTGTNGVRLRLIRLAPGLVVPAHGHAGNEYTLVLSGAFQDDTSRRFAAGDLCVLETGESHLQRVENRGPCFALQLNQGPLLPLTWKGRLLSALFDRPWSR